MKKVQFVHVRDISDATSWYNVLLLQPMTVREFVDLMLAEHPDEWGDFHVRPSHRILCEYKYGKITSTNDEQMNEIGDKRIVRVDANGGWSMMSYFFEVEE